MIAIDRKEDLMLTINFSESNKIFQSPSKFVRGAIVSKQLDYDYEKTESKAANAKPV